MNTWSSFINRKSINEAEELSKEKMITAIKDILNNPELDDDTLFDAYNAFMKSYMPEAIIPYLEQRGCEDCAKQIISCLRQNFKDADNLIKAINNPNLLSPSVELTNHDNIYDMFKNYSKKFIDNISDISPQKNGVSRGKYEVLLCLLLQDITEKNTGTCDVNCKQAKIEVKGSQARIIGTNHWATQAADKVIFKYIEDEFGIKENEAISNINTFSGIYANQTNLVNILLYVGNYVKDSGNEEYVKKFNELLDSKFRELIIESIYTTFNIKGNGAKKLDKNAITTYINSFQGKYDPIGLILDNVKSSLGITKHNDGLEVNKNPSDSKVNKDLKQTTDLNDDDDKPLSIGGLFKLMLATISLHRYHELEGFDYFFIINTTKGTVGKYIIIQEFDDLTTLSQIISGNLKLKTLPSNKEGQAGAVQIECVK